MGREVAHAASIKSVCLLKNAGIWIMSKTFEANSASSGLCISEIRGTL